MKNCLCKQNDNLWNSIIEMGEQQGSFYRILARVPGFYLQHASDSLIECISIAIRVLKMLTYTNISVSLFARLM